jgi:ABC-type molybdate transport system substrate-binding protein
MQQIIAASGLPQRNVATPVLGPAGLLRKRLQSGESTDLFVSTDVAQPRAVATDDGGLVVPFARNRMCLVGWDRLGLTRDNALDKMLSPDLRLATSTPGADPGGDYARAVFARAEAVHPGAQAALTEKALTLVGGPGSAQPQPSYAPAAAIFADNRADLFLYYCTGAAVVMSQVPGLSAVPMPDDLEVYPVYWLAVLSDRPEAERLALFMVSEHGQAILSHNGLLPLVER